MLRPLRQTYLAKYWSQAALAVMMELPPHCCLDVQVFLAVLQELAVARLKQARSNC